MTQRLAPGFGDIDESGTTSQRMVPDGFDFDEQAAASGFQVAWARFANVLLAAPECEASE